MKSNIHVKETNRHEFGEYVHMRELGRDSMRWAKRWLNRIYRRTKKEELKMVEGEK